MRVAFWLRAVLLLAAGTLAAPEAVAAACSFLPSVHAAVPSSDPAPITLTAYRDRLLSAESELATRGAAGAGAVATSLRTVDKVQAPDGSLVHPNLAAAIAALDAQPPDVAGARTRLQALLSELNRSASLAGATGATADTRDSLQRVLDRPEFRQAGPPPDPIGDFLREKWNSFVDWLRQLLSPVIEALPKVDLHPLAVVVGLLLVGGLIFWVVRNLRRTMAPDLTSVLGEELADGVSSEALRAQALELARKGEFRAAVRSLYLAVLLQWDERGKLRFDRALTNQEVLTRLGEDAAAVQRLAPLVERFDRFWYGAVPCSSEEYADFASLAAAAWEAA